MERETGRLLPRWVSAIFYIIFVPWCIFAFIWIGASMVIQHRIWGAIEVIGGPWKGEAPAMESPEIKTTIAVLQKEPRDGLLYILQQLQQDEIDDPRMARAIVLKSSIRWAFESRVRLLLNELLENIRETGEMETSYKLSEESIQTLRELLLERQERPSTSNEEQKITEVLLWLAGGRPTPPVGTEQRRLASLKTRYDKNLFFGAESRVLSMIAEEWEASSDPVRRGVAEKFKLMLRGEPAKLSPEEDKLCSDQAAYWERLYLTGRERLCRVAGELVEIIVRDGIRLDHPNIWDLVRMLDERYEPASRHIVRALITLKANKYTISYLSEAVLRAGVNPVMAVETAKLTKNAHEQLLKEEQLRRRLASLEVMREIARTYCRKEFSIQGVEPGGQDKFFKEKVIRTLKTLINDKQVGERAGAIVDELRKACPQYFDS